MTTEQMPEAAFMRPEAAARFLGMSKRHLGNLTQRGVIPACRLGRRCVLYSRKELESAVLKFQSGKVRG